MTPNAPRHLATADLRILGLPGGVQTLIIESDAYGVLLLRFGPAGEFIGDTFHTTIDEAKSQADFEFDLPAAAWSACELDSQ